MWNLRKTEGWKGGSEGWERKERRKERGRKRKNQTYRKTDHIRGYEQWGVGGGGGRWSKGIHVQLQDKSVIEMPCAA